MAHNPAHAKFLERFVRPKEGRTLIVGSKIYAGRDDRRACYKEVLGVDMLPGLGVDLCVDLCARDLDVVQVLRGTFSHIECWSVLEHASRPWVLAANLQRLLFPGGTLHLTVPFVWRVHAYPSDYWRFTIAGVRQLFPDIRWDHLLYADEHLHHRKRTRSASVEGCLLPAFVRTEVFGFGVRR